MNVLICDDERRDLQMVRLHVEQFGKDQQIDVSIYTLWNPKSSAEIMAMAENMRWMSHFWISTCHIYRVMRLPVH